MWWTDSIPLTAPRQPLLQRSAAELLLPLWLLALPLLLWLGPGGVDHLWASTLFSWSGGAWTLKHAWWSEHLIHQGGRRLVILAALVMLAWIAWAHWRNRNALLKRRIGYVFLTSLLSTVLVSTLKHSISAQCPWDQLDFGGSQAAVGWWQGWLSAQSAEHCFPAGHASSGFGWLGLVFAFQSGRWRWPAIAIPLLIGPIFAFDQQLRGAHFLSHDLMTLSLCWTVAVLLRPLLPAQPLSHRSAP